MRHTIGSPRRQLLLAAVGGLALLHVPLAFTPSPGAEEAAALASEKVEYKGWKNNWRLSNGDVEIIITGDVGPRIISYRLTGGKTVFKEYADQLGKSGEKDWQIRGGHRLWIAPEDLTRTYEPDNSPVTAEEANGRLRVFATAKSNYGVKKEMEISLAKKGSRVHVLHRLRNEGDKPVELAPWALSVMAPGGIEIIPLPPKKPHPGAPTNAKSPKDFAPNQQIVMWPFFDFKDPRWEFGTKYITLRQDAKRGPTKIGLAHQLDWVGYLNNGTLFVKHVPFKEGKTYPDNGCNFETFTNEDMLEIESLGPLVKLGPKEEVEHVEEWELFADVGAVTDEASIDKNVLAKLTGK